MAMKALYATRVPDTTGRLSRRRVTDVMRRPAPTVSSRLPLQQALVTMNRLGVRHLVAVDDQGRCVGVLSDRAVAARWAFTSPSPLQQTVLSTLDIRPAVIPSSWVVGHAAKFMIDAGVDAVAVADPEGHAVGLLTGADLISMSCAEPAHL